MLRPERMSKVSITGSKSVMEDVITVLHRLSLIHLEDYDERWEEFRTGEPLAQGETVSERLVTVRALLNTLDVSNEDRSRVDLPDEETADARLESVRSRVTALEDERNEVMANIREIQDDLDRLEPLVTLGIDLDLLQDYERLEVAVGRGQPDAINASLEDSDAIEGYELFEHEGVIAIAAMPATDASGVITEALVGVEFNQIDVPDGEGDPETIRDELNQRLDELDRSLERIEADLETEREEHGDFLLALEEALSIASERASAPLQFATTRRSFIAEGWVPSRRVAELESTLGEVVGDRVEVDELERVDYDPPHEHTAAHDGGEDLELHGDHPPVIQRNPSIVKPFEVFVQTVNRPRYHEIDPTIFVFLTFPLAFGYMIGDIGYGLLYIAMGWALIKFTDSRSMWALAMIAVWAGIFTILFGYLYDDIFGVHMADLGISLPLAGSLDKGLQIVEVAQLWIVASILFGVLHLGIGYALGFVNNLEHGLGEAFAEKGAWLLVLGGLFVWIFSVDEAGTAGWAPGPLGDMDLTATAIKPAFLVGSEGVLYSNYLFDIGFVGFSETVAIIALAAFLIGWVFTISAEGFIAIIEMPTNAFGHAVSYLRMMAVLLAKGGMAFVVNLIVFGAYATDRMVGGEEISYTVFHLPTYDVTGYEQVFPGLVHLDPLWVTIPAAILVFIFGHIVVLLLGITAAGIQMTRLEYVEFFGKFYDGGGAKFQPFGYKKATGEEH